jgi:hypothetical protein
MISPVSRDNTLEIVVPNSKYRQPVAVEKSKNYSSVANGSHFPSTHLGGGKRAFRLLEKRAPTGLLLGLVRDEMKGGLMSLQNAVSAIFLKIGYWKGGSK